MKQHIIMIDDLNYFSSLNLIQAMAERAIAWRKYSRIHRITMLVEER